MLLIVGSVFAVANASELVRIVQWSQDGFSSADWHLLATIDPRDPYATEWFKWSIPAAWIWSGVVVPMGAVLWRMLHIVVLVLLPWRVALVVALTFPFWMDFASGNVLTFVFVLAWNAIEGRRWAIVGYCILAVLIPRPIMIPVLLWLLWRHNDARWAFAAAAAAVVGLTVALGEMGTWLSHLVATPAIEMAQRFNYSPSYFVGWAWVLVAWPVAVFAFAKGWLGIASVLVSPYIIHYYWIMLALDLRHTPLGVRSRPGT